MRYSFEIFFLSLITVGDRPRDQPRGKDQGVEAALVDDHRFLFSTDGVAKRDGILVIIQDQRGRTR